MSFPHSCQVSGPRFSVLLKSHPCEGSHHIDSAGKIGMHTFSRPTLTCQHFIYIQMPYLSPQVVEGVPAGGETSSGGGGGETCLRPGAAAL